MGEYADTLSKIRAARTSRDEAQQTLYGLQVKHIALKKQEKKNDNKDVVVDDATAKAIAAIQKDIADAQAKLAGIQVQLAQLAAAEQLLKDQTALLVEIQKEAQVITDRIALIDRQLQDGALGDEDKKKLIAERQALQDQLANIQKKINDLKQRLEELRRKIDGSRQQTAVLQARAGQLQEEINRKKKELSVLINQQQQPQDGNGGIEDSRNKIIKQKGIVNERTNVITSQIGNLFAQRTPRQLIEEWSDNIPIALFPLRIETKFSVANPNAGAAGETELWVRIFPDDIAVVTHEKILTQQEAEYGTAYWKALWNAKDDEEQKKTSWRILTDKFGPNRSAWVALQTKPANWSAAGGLTSEDDLQFPVFDLTKPNTWTEAPHTRILPDRFVLLGYRAGVLVQTAISNQVSDILTLGPAPMDDADNPSITRNDADQKLNFGDDFKWLVDFEIAVKNGMGFKIRSTDRTNIAAGFDQLLVVGLKLSADENDGKQLLEDLFDNHHYSKDGLAIVKQGTPTNNTDEKDAGYTKQDILQTTSFFVETGNPLFTPTDTKLEATDGQRLAEYLGIEYTPLQYIVNSDARDNTEAVAMNKGLYAGTLGYYFNSMLNEVMDDQTIGKVRHHFTNYVTGRGPIAAIRVGNQPYGILPVSAFDKWKYPTDQGRLLKLADNFFPALYNVLKYLANIWQSIVPQLAHIGKTGDTGANLVSVLGLQPTSVEYFQRVGYTYDYLKNLEKFKNNEKFIWDVYKMEWDQFIIPLVLKQFGYNKTRDNGTQKPVPLLLQLIYRHYNAQLDGKNLIDGLPFSEENKIKPYDEGLGLNYIDWMLNNTGSKKIEDEDFGGTAKPSSLLYMLLRHSLLHESSFSIYKFLAKSTIQADELVRSRKFSNISTAPSVSHWEIFEAPVNTIVPAEASAMPLFEYIHSPRFSSPADTDVAQNLKDHKWALTVLKDMHTSPLERTLAEHMDTLTYRLDAWQTSLFDLRLREQRSLNGAAADRKKGIYIGAYGYLENVKPNPGKRVKIPDDVLPVPLRENKNNLFTDSENGGYVHAPTLNHATAAAILRNGYLTHANPADKEALAVNLSSERVRRAQYLIEGIRNGQTLEVLLGYLFERGLHDWSTRPVGPVILNDLIPVFRKAFPIKKTKVPQQGNTTGPEETIEDYHVVNGLELAKLTIAFPYGITFPAPLSADKIAAIAKEKGNIENTLDAMRDLLTSESAYQLALGNFDRAAAVMQSISAGQMPPGIDVINSARGTDLAFTNRVVVHFDSTLTANPWPAVPMTLRAQTEPGLNHWVGDLLGDPAKTKCRVKAVDADGNILQRSDNTSIEGAISLEDIKVQPVDFMYLISNKLEETGNSELESRVRYKFAQDNSLSDATIIKIEFANGNAGADTTIRSFAELLPLADYIRQLICGGRPLGDRNYQIASKKITAASDNPNNVNAAEFLARVQAAFTVVSNLFAQLETAVTDAETLKTETAVTTLRNLLKQLADGGYVFSFPQSAFGFSAAEIELLVTQGKSLIKGFDAFIIKYNDQLVKVNDVATKPPQKISLLTEIAKALLGADYVMLPKFDFTSPSEIAQSYSGKDDLLTFAKTKTPLVVDEWLHGISQVRPTMHRLEMIRLLNDSMNEKTLELLPIQLPYRANDSWLAVEFPEGTTIDHDTLSFIQITPQGFNAAQAQCGLMLDDWTESIPNKEEVTGITFNYNQPNTVPPQVILLAVTPEETGHWKWDNLVDTILDSFARAKQRAVEPDLIDNHGVITTLLPALVAEFSTGRNTVSLDYSLNIAAVAKSVVALQFNK